MLQARRWQHDSDGDSGGDSGDMGDAKKKCQKIP